MNWIRPQICQIQRILLILTFSLTFYSVGQTQNCSVNLDSIKGQYNGGCKNGKADGFGTATGIDSYSGEFRNGYPEGEGKYTWRNGDWYEGSWRAGRFDGKGRLQKLYQPDSAVVLTGYWKKGKYLGLYEKPYVIHSTSNDVSSLEVRKQETGENEITVIIKNVIAGASNLSYLKLPKSRLIDVQVLSGRFESEIPDESASSTYNRYVLKKVTFPFRAVFIFDIAGGHTKGDEIDVEFLENSHWLVQVNLDN